MDANETQTQPFDLIPGFEAYAVDADSDTPISDPRLVACALTATFGLHVAVEDVEFTDPGGFLVPLTRELADQLVANGFWGVETAIQLGDADPVMVSLEVEWPDGGSPTWR